MAVVEVGIVWVPVHERLVTVPMGMRLLPQLARRVCVLVVFVVHVPVLMFHRLVGVLVLVPLGQVQVEAEGHERGSD